MLLQIPNSHSQSLQLSGTLCNEYCGVWAVPYFAGDGKNVMYEVRDRNGFHGSRYGILYIHIPVGFPDQTRIILPDMVQKTIAQDSDFIKHVDSSGTVITYSLVSGTYNYCEYANDVISLVKGFITNIPASMLDVIQRIDGCVKL